MAGGNHLRVPLSVAA